MTEESHAAMMRALDDVKLDADMRAMAENAMQHFASLTAEPSAAQIVAESQAESDAGGAGGGMDAPTGMTVAPMVPEPYHPVSLFRLKFTFGSDGSYSGVTMEDPKFLWNEVDEDGNPSVSLKTAGVGTIGLNGTVYLNVTLSGEDGAKKFASAQVSMSSNGDVSVPLYQLDPAKGVVKDYRHAMISLGVGTPGDSAGVDVSTSSYTTQGGGSGIGVTFQPTKNGENEGDSAGLGIEVDEIQPTTGNPGGVTLKLQRAKNGQADGNPVSVTISNGADSTVPGPQGVGVGSVDYKSTSGRTKTYSVMSDETTPTELGTFAVTDGNDGDDGASVTSATAGTATSSGGKTTTPITFTLSNGNTVGPVNVEAQNGTNATLPNFDFLSPYIRYSNYKLQVRLGHCRNGAITYDDDEHWTDVFTAIPHSSTVAGSGS